VSSPTINRAVARLDRDDPICKLEGCQRKRLSRGWCKRHYNQWLRTGIPGDPGTPPEQTSKKVMLARLQRAMKDHR